MLSTLSLPLAGVLCLASACAATSAEDAAAGGSDGSSSNVTSVPTVPIFESDIVPILARSCGAGADSCHSKKVYAPNANNGCLGWLSMADQPLGGQGCKNQDLYQRLLTQAWQCTDEDGGRYVVPCDPDKSYIVRKIDGVALCKVDQGNGAKMSESMPFGGTIDPTERETIVRWIETGAQTADGRGSNCGN